MHKTKIPESPYNRFLGQIKADITRIVKSEKCVTPHFIRDKTGYNWRTVKKYLDALAREGIVKEQRVGHIFVYTLQEESKYDE